MTTKLKWRLGKLPTPEELRDLVKDKILTTEEAREILFSLENDEDRDKKSLQEEILFLRQLVNSLSSASKIVEHIRYVEKPYYNSPWYQPYLAYCSSVNNTSQSLYALNSATNATTASVAYTAASQAIDPDFTDIDTF